MKLICPHCGLKGTADDALLAKKIRCPQCRKVFRLDETVTVTTAAVPATAPEVGICSVCGFSLSYTYLEERAARLFCRLCLPA